MHVTFGRVSASRWETTSYELRDGGAVAFNKGHDCDSERVVHINLSRHLSFSDNVSIITQWMLSLINISSLNLCKFVGVVIEG